MGSGRSFVCILASVSRVLYVGVTNNLTRKVWEHQNGVNKGFTSKYRVYQLVYFEEYPSPLEAIAREKQLKRWRRAKKVALIRKINLTWKDLSR